jgi:transposase-like protein
MDTRRKFSREFKLEAVKMVKERGVALKQVARDLDLNENMLRRWVREFGVARKMLFPDLEPMVPGVDSRWIVVNAARLQTTYSIANFIQPKTAAFEVWIRQSCKVRRIIIRLSQCPRFRQQPSPSEAGACQDTEQLARYDRTPEEGL